MGFPVVRYGCESWTIKKAEHWRIDAFGLWCWRRLLRVPWTARRSSQSILKKISPECSLEGLILKLNLLYFGHLMWRADSFEKTLMLVKIEGRRRGCNGWMTLPTQWAWIRVNSRSWWWTGRPGMLQSMGSQRVGHNWATEVNWMHVLVMEDSGVFDQPQAAWEMFLAGYNVQSVIHLSPHSLSIWCGACLSFFSV